jgi:hypothetical protein
LYAIALISEQVRAININGRVQKREVSHANLESEDNQVAIVPSHGHIILSAVGGSEFCYINGNRCSCRGRGRHDEGNCWRGVSFSRGTDAQLSIDELVHVVAAGINNGIPGLQLWLCNIECRCNRLARIGCKDRVNWAFID